jgi:hypothetical protein
MIRRHAALVAPEKMKAIPTNPFRITGQSEP